MAMESRAHMSKSSDSSALRILHVAGQQQGRDVEYIIVLAVSPGGRFCFVSPGSSSLKRN